MDHDEERYTARREKIYSFCTIPKELEKFMSYGSLQCADSFLYIFTFLPIRYVMALWALISRPIMRCLKKHRGNLRVLTPAETCDLLKGTIWIIVSLGMLFVDTNMLYHLIKSQSIIKLYIFYNMLEVGDRLLSAFGQDIIDALFWTATEPKDCSKIGVVGHFLIAICYVLMHSLLVMFQATALNVAINSNNKGLLTIMMSNNFVELKGSVFKKFDKNNLFQLTCSDVRERFHLSILLLIVAIQTMREFNWKPEQFWILLPDCICVLVTEFLVDWIKHAFITRFNEIPIDVYKEYTISLAYDMTQTRQKHAFSDHSDLVARRMGFIPFPLGVVLVKSLYHALSFKNFGSILIFILAYIFLLSCRVLNTICTLGKACDIMQKHQEDKNQILNPSSAMKAKISKATIKVDSATSPFHQNFLQKINSVSVSPEDKKFVKRLSNSNSDLDETNLKIDNSLGALFSNSDVDLEDVHLNDKVLKQESDLEIDEVLTRSEPDLQSQIPSEPLLNVKSEIDEIVLHRTHKRSESEPSITLEKQ